MVVAVNRCLGALVRSLVVASLCLAATAVNASGGDAGSTGPLPTTAPSIPLTEFAGGRLGILDATFQRAYLVAAWRVLDERPLTAKEAKILSSVMRESSSYEVGKDSEGKNEWLDVLREYGNFTGNFRGIAQSRFSLRDETGDNSLDLSSYPNCSLEATRTAAKTLRERATAYGNALKNPWVAQWVAGQNQVFANCASGFALPDDAPPDAPKWFKQDRAYQRAAARFYAGRFTEAREEFDFIAKDKDSPWAELAPYLAGRSLLRRASLSKNPSDADIRMVEARLRFEQLARSGTDRQRRMAEAMLRRIRVSRQPADLLAESARRIGEQAWDSDTDLLLGDFLTLMRTVVDQRGISHGSAKAKELWARDDGGMADWIADMNLLQHMAPAGREFEEGFGGNAQVSAAIAAKACRQAQGTVHPKAWLLTCVASAAAPADVPPKVLSQALSLKPTDAAYPTVRFHLCRLQVDALSKGDLAGLAQLTGNAQKDASTAATQMRKELEDAMSKGDQLWAPEGLNALSLLRARLASSVGELLRFNRLQSVEDAPQYAWHQEVGRAVKPNAKELYPYATVLLSRGLTTATLAAASEDASLSAAERKYLRRMAWVRAAVLEQQDILDRLTSAVSADYPQHADGLEAVRQAADTKVRRFELARMLLADARLTVLYQEEDVARVYDNYSGWYYVKPIVAPPGFFTAAQQSTADEEARRLQQLQDSTSFIGNALIAWSQVAPKDGRLAPALSQLVHATRNNSLVADRTVSKRAFQALHRLFPNSPSAKATKYYY